MFMRLLRYKSGVRFMGYMGCDNSIIRNPMGGAAMIKMFGVMNIVIPVITNILMMMYMSMVVR